MLGPTSPSPATQIRAESPGTGQVAGPLPPEQIIARLEPFVLPRRAERMRHVLESRTAHVAFVFEDLVDPHNLSAALRSLEAFSFQDMHLVNPAARIEFARKVTSGSERWLSVHDHDSLLRCVDDLRRLGYRVLASHLEEGSPVPLTGIDWSRPTALIFGNEHAGVTEQALALADGTFRIDMLGFVESLNLSVAAAITAFHVRRELERLAAQAGDPKRFALPLDRQRKLYAGWLRQTVRNAERILEDADI
jgi:tRNA (guanosine-2'-O-)-methyltransferase